MLPPIPKAKASTRERAKKILDEIEGVKGQYGIDFRSEGFLKDMVRRDLATLSNAQEKWLTDLEIKVFGEQEEETEEKELDGQLHYKGKR